MNAPPANRAQIWFRRLLWLVPTIIVIASLIGFSWLARMRWLNIHHGWLVLIVSALLTYGVGVFESFLGSAVCAADGERQSESVFYRALAFFLLQCFFIVPTSLMVLAFFVIFLGGFL